MFNGYFVAFALISALIWCGFIWIYGHAFSWSEWVTGIHIIYLPHGLRMILVILFQSAGAVGIVLGSAIMGADLIRANPALGLTQSAVAGLAVWLAARLVLKATSEPSLLPQTVGGIAALNGRSLITFSVASAVFNASGHCVAWYLFDAEAKQFETRFAIMFTGDLLGAVFLLYALRWLVLFLERNGNHPP